MVRKTHNIPLQSNPDTVWSYEVGEKARIDDERITVDADIYYENWNKVQQQVTLGCGFFFTANASNATVYGSELEASEHVTSHWTLAQSLGYTHATFDSADAAAEIVKGEGLLNVPRVSGTGSVTYTQPLTATTGFSARALYWYFGSMQDLTYARNNLPGYGLLKLRAGVDSHALSAFIFVDNATNKFAWLGNAAALSASIPSLNRVVTNQPRTIGLQLQFRR
jgi:outer membrane receptor protein involved in Fe transport